LPRGRRLHSGRVASRMDRTRSGYSATTARSAPLRSVEKHPFAQPQRIGCPILRALCEGWEATALHPEALARNFCLSHPSRKTRRMGHPILCERARNTRRHHLAISLGFSSPWVGRRLMTPLSKIKLRPQILIGWVSKARPGPPTSKLLVMLRFCRLSKAVPNRYGLKGPNDR
jgi:hypothetical protein